MKMQADFIGMIVKDLAAATAFYRDQLGWPVNEAESIPGLYTQFALEGDTIVSLLVQNGALANHGVEVGIKVEDADTTFAAWQGQGVTMVEEPNDKPFGRSFLCHTPEGHLLRVYAAHS